MILESHLDSWPRSAGQSRTRAPRLSTRLTPQLSALALVASVGVASGIRRDTTQSGILAVRRVFGLGKPIRESRRADSNRLPLLQLRVITQALQGFSRDCKCRIFRGVSFLCLAACCTVLRSRWYQSGINLPQKLLAGSPYCTQRLTPLRSFEFLLLSGKYPSPPALFSSSS
jgi:hypothetical protein